MKEYLHIPQINYFKYGNFFSVAFDDFKKLFFLIKHGVNLIIHSHPPGISSNYSQIDLKVMKNLWIATGKPILYGIVGNNTVSYFLMESKIPELVYYRVVTSGEEAESGEFLFDFRKDLKDFEWIFEEKFNEDLRFKIFLKEVERKLKNLDYLGLEN